MRWPRDKNGRWAPTDVSCHNKKPNICCKHRRKGASAKQLQEDARLYCCYYGALEVLRTCKTAVQNCYFSQKNAAECHSYKTKISVTFAKCRKVQT